MMVGDIITLVVNQDKGHISFIINGKNHGTAFRGIRLETLELYPGVSLEGDARVSFSER
jgi:hypothetical protein